MPLYVRSTLNVPFVVGYEFRIFSDASLSDGVAAMPYMSTNIVVFIVVSCGNDTSVAIADGLGAGSFAFKLPFFSRAEFEQSSNCFWHANTLDLVVTVISFRFSLSATWYSGESPLIRWCDDVADRDVSNLWCCLVIEDDGAGVLRTTFTVSKRLLKFLDDDRSDRNVFFVLVLPFADDFGVATILWLFALAVFISSAALRNRTKAAATLPFGKFDGFNATAGVEEADSEETSVDAEVDVTVGAIRTGVDKMSFLVVVWFEEFGGFLYDGIVNDCSGDDNCTTPLFGAAPPNVVCTKFDEFLNNLVKLLVLNDNKPFDAELGVFGSATGDVTVGVAAGSDLIRIDFVFWLNIILTW